MKTQKALIIVNRLARQGDSDFDLSTKIFRDYGIEPYVVLIEQVSQIASVIEKHRNTVDRIIIGGGDGTLNAAVEQIGRAHV